MPRFCTVTLNQLNRNLGDEWSFIISKCKMLKRVLTLFLTHALREVCITFVCPPLVARAPVEYGAHGGSRRRFLYPVCPCYFRPTWPHPLPRIPDITEPDPCVTLTDAGKRDRFDFPPFDRIEMNGVVGKDSALVKLINFCNFY